MNQKQPQRFKPPHIPGAYCSAEGFVVYQFAEISPSMDLFVCGGHDLKIDCRFSNSALVFPVNYSAVDFSTGGSAPSTADARSVLVVPHGTEFTVRAVTAIITIAVLSPRKPLLDKAAALYNIPAKNFAGVFSKYQDITRTNWINEILQRYLWERESEDRKQPETLAFLETEIIKEVYYRAHAPNNAVNYFNLDETNVYGSSPVLKRALAYIEKHLFSEISMQALAKSAFVSEATLLRAFGNRFNLTPFEYILNRRLSYSMLLLSSGNYTVSEIAGILGYTTVCGFVAAFKEKYKITPTAWRARRNPQGK